MTRKVGIIHQTNRPSNHEEEKKRLSLARSRGKERVCVMPELIGERYTSEKWKIAWRMHLMITGEALDTQRTGCNS